MGKYFTLTQNSQLRGFWWLLDFACENLQNNDECEHTLMFHMSAITQDICARHSGTPLIHSASEIAFSM